MDFGNKTFNFALLTQAIESGLIDPETLEKKLEESKRERCLAKHIKEHSVWQGPDGWWNTYAGKGKTRKRIRKRLREDFDKALLNFYENEGNNPTVKEIFDEWKNHKLEFRKISVNTLDRYNCIFNRHFKPIESIRIGSLGPNLFEEFLERQIIDFNLSHKAFSNLKSVCKGMLLWAKRKNYINWSVFGMIEDMDISDKQFRKNYKEDYEEVFDDEETDKLIKYLCKNPDSVNLAILLLYLTGMRVGELVVLRKDDIEGNLIKVRRTESRAHKDSVKLKDLNPEGIVIGPTHYYHIKNCPKTDAGNRNVLIPTDFMGIIEKLIKGTDSPFLFTDAEGCRITTNVIRRRLTNINNLLGIHQKSPHKLRKTYATILLDNNLDHNLITSLMGHTDLSMTEGHYHRNRKSDEKRSAILSSLSEFKTSTFGIAKLEENNET